MLENNSYLRRNYPNFNITWKIIWVETRIQHFKTHIHRVESAAVNNSVFIVFRTAYGIAKIVLFLSTFSFVSSSETPEELELNICIPTVEKVFIIAFIIPYVTCRNNHIRPQHVYTFWVRFWIDLSMYVRLIICWKQDKYWTDELGWLNLV